jgi:hypothetical protein
VICRAAVLMAGIDLLLAYQGVRDFGHEPDRNGG